MSDVFDKEKRSSVMSAIRGSKNKSTEMRLVEIFREFNISGWRRKYKIKGKPDFVFLKQRVAVFVDGCFWHGHDCRNVTPATNIAFWEKKLSANKNRDISVTKYLTDKGWQVIRIWECELKKKNISIVTSKLAELIEQTKPLTFNEWEKNS